MSVCIGESGKYRLADVGYVGIRSASSYTYITYVRISVLSRFTDTHGHNTLIEVVLVIPLELLAPPELIFDTNLPHKRRARLAAPAGLLYTRWARYATPTRLL